MDRTSSLSELFRAVQGRSNSLEEKLSKWAKPPSDTEKDKMNRTLRMVKEGIKATEAISYADYVEATAKGSFKSRTNIPSDSDVDVAAVHTRYYLNTYPPGMTNGDFGFSEAAYSHATFKAELAKAMVEKNTVQTLRRMRR